MKKSKSIMQYIIIVLLFVGSVGYADPASRDTVIRYYGIHPVAFDPEYYGHMWQKDAGRVWAYSSNVSFFAPVYLPDSAKVVEFKAWVRDSFPTHNITVSLYRIPLNGTSVYPMAIATSTAGAGDQELTDTEIDYSIIDNTIYKYCARASLSAPDSRHSLYGMRIKYEIVQTSPSVDETGGEFINSAASTVSPTPFSHYTSINYHVPKSDHVSIRVYDEAGRLVRTLVDEIMAQGSYTARWDGKNSNGRKVATGSYFCVVKTDGCSSTKVVRIE